MKTLFKPLALGGLALSLLSPILLFANAINFDLMKLLMLVGMILWYLGATPWLGFGGKSSESADSHDPTN